ncbi:unnamed protein product [Calicophoron daubneyi]|uniref:von Willebrand factor A domain-containing protein 5A n=1 Tax=Calicophoron daubneyi TaxID=300641 RepID=A0AAV2T4N3_CALDB
MQDFWKPYGLIAVSENEQPIELKDVQITCSVLNLTSNVTTKFTYKNQHLQQVQGSFVFPLEDVAVYDFEAEVDGRKIVAKCRPRAEAKTTYDEAVASGHAAFLAEQEEHCEDVFQMSIGNIPPNGTVIIQLKYVGHLQCENTDGNGSSKSQAVFTLPSVINPRYSPADSAIKSEFEPFAKAVSMNSCTYSLSFEAILLMPEDITVVRSERDTYSVEFSTEGRKSAKVKLTSTFKPDHDLQMVIQMSGQLSSFGICEPGDPGQMGILGKDCLMAQFMPNFSEFEDIQEQRNEVYFVVDRSGSMSGSNIQHASSSLLLFLKSLPAGCRFQIIGFGSGHDCLFQEPTDYNETSLERALQYQREMTANMGGTEVLPALKTAFDSPLSGQGWYKQIVFLTDGDVSNADEVIGLVSSNVDKGRLFAIGIGEGCSTNLVSGVARAGRGMAAFIRDNAQMHGAVMKILKEALQPRASEISVKWSVTKKNASGTANPVNVISIPTKVPPVFAGRFLTMYGILPEENRFAELSGEVVLEYEILGTKYSLRIDMASVQLHQSQPDKTDVPIHRLAGKCQMTELSDKYKAESMRDPEKSKSDEAKSLRSQIEQLSCAINVLSIFTGLVGVDPVKQEIPAEAPAPPPMFCESFGRIPAPCGGGIGGFGAMPRFALFNCSSMARPAANICIPQSLSQSVVFPAAPPIPNTNGGVNFEDACVPESLSQSVVPPAAPPTRGTTGGVNFGEKKIVESPLLRLVELQNIAGFWNLVEDLAKCINMSLDSLQKSQPKTWSASCTQAVTDRIWATALVLAYLHSKLSASVDEWELVGKKAKAWLIQQASMFEKSPPTTKKLVEGLIEQAKLVVNK